MTTPAAPPGVYRSRSRVTRTRLVLGAAAVALVLLGYLIGRLQDDPPPAAVTVAAPATTAVPAAPASDAASPEPPAPPATTAPAPPGTDAYSVIQAEAAAGQQGTQSQPTEDDGGGQNVGWISDGDWLRFDNVDFGDTPATRFAARIAADVHKHRDDGRIEIRIDSPANPPAGALQTGDTGGWQDWETRTTGISPTTGRHTVFLTFANGDDDHGDRHDDEFVNINYFAFAH
jgi:hypothetical protein